MILSKTQVTTCKRRVIPMYCLKSAFSKKEKYADSLENNYLSSISNDKLHALINVAVKKTASQQKYKTLKALQNQIKSKDNYQYTSDKKSISLALIKSITIDDLCSYIALGSGLLFICLLSLKITILSVEWFREEMVFAENKLMFTNMPCQTTYFEKETFKDAYPNVKMPEYMPDGYSLYRTYATTDPHSFSATSVYLDEAGTLISVVYEEFHPDSNIPTNTVEADPKSYKSFEKDGILYEQVTNCGKYSILWEEEYNKHYMMFGVDTENNVHKIIESMK